MIDPCHENVFSRERNENAFEELTMFSGINQVFVRMTDHPDLGKLLLRLTLGDYCCFMVSLSSCMAWAGLPIYCDNTVCRALSPGVPGWGNNCAADADRRLHDTASGVYHCREYGCRHAAGQNRRSMASHRCRCLALETEALYLFGALVVMFLGREDLRCSVIRACSKGKRGGSAPFIL